MDNSGEHKKPSNQPKLRINLKDSDLRTGPKDRRKVHTYIANDRRSGLADRRKNENKINS
jgi:hypothetical protein